jgi:PTS system N-acetylglucosamine-specific IIC component
MFLAPLLYAIHAVLTGVSMALMNALGIKLGFGFSAGAFDYALNFPKATRPILLFPIGAVYALLYYGIFRFAIVRFNLKTPGREDDPVGEEIAEIAPAERGKAFVAAAGGAANLASIDACTTRLRLVVNDHSKVDEARLRALGAHGILRPSEKGLQVVVGPTADAIAMEMREAAGALASVGSEGAAARAVQPIADATPWLAAIGGRSNLRESGAASSRVWLELGDSNLLDQDALKKLGVRMIARPAADTIHLLVDDADSIAAALQAA